MQILGKYPLKRFRRNRNKKFVRRLLLENQISVCDLIYPVFIIEGNRKVQKIPSMPGVNRYSLDNILKLTELCLKKGITAIALFPVIEKKLKDMKGKEAFNEKGLIPKALKVLKKEFPDIVVITDIALDPYTIHGQDGIIDKNGLVINDETVEVLIKQALTHAAFGSDILAPSDMMDGRILKLREALDIKKFKDISIMSYAAKFSSSMYAPFREAVKSSKNVSGGKETYQIEPANLNESIQEVGLDIREGADFILIKPGLPYLDVLSTIKKEFSYPTFVYQVSGEYSMLESAFEKKWLNKEKVLIEIMKCFKRSGADGIFTYHALDVADILIKDSQII